MAQTTSLDFAIRPRALERIRETARREGVDLSQTCLRIAIIPGGCSGLTYDLGWDTTVREDDQVATFDGLRVVMDLKSALYVEGAALDFSDGLEGRGFFLDNPQAVRTCACGESFGL